MTGPCARRSGTLPKPNGVLDAEGSMSCSGGKHWLVNHKKVERLYREERLSLRLRKRRKFAPVPRVELPMPDQPGKVYAMDFVHDRMANGRRFKCLTMTDPCSKEAPVIEVDFSIQGCGSVGFWTGSLRQAIAGDPGDG